MSHYLGSYRILLCLNWWFAFYWFHSSSINLDRIWYDSRLENDIVMGPRELGCANWLLVLHCASLKVEKMFCSSLATLMWEACSPAWYLSRDLCTASNYTSSTLLSLDDDVNWVVRSEGHFPAVFSAGRHAEFSKIMRAVKLIVKQACPNITFSTWQSIYIVPIKTQIQ